MFHELATNAAKYGALSAAGGTPTIEWQVAEGPAVSDVVLRWTETGGPSISRSRPTGLHCTIRFSVKRGTSSLSRSRMAPPRSR